MSKDMLETMFAMQKELAIKYGKHPSLFDAKERGHHVFELLGAISSEIEELRDCTWWKHWCKKAQEGFQFVIYDYEMGRIELVDIFHFFMDLCMCFNMEPKELFALYCAKNNVNQKRFEFGYDTDNKTEEDNLKIIEDNRKLSTD